MVKAMKTNWKQTKYCILSNDLTECIDMDAQRLIELHELAKLEASRYPRKQSAYRDLVQDVGKHYIGIIGPRGAGKTILLRQYAREHAEAFYLSADVLDTGDDPWTLIKTLNEHFGYSTFLIDEIHFLPDATALLKRLYDFLAVRVLFTSSTALAMYASQEDLSRRVRMVTLPVFSFQEYLHFAHQTDLPSLELEAVIARQWQPEHLRVGRYFDASRVNAAPRRPTSSLKVPTNSSSKSAAKARAAHSSKASPSTESSSSLTSPCPLKNRFPCIYSASWPARQAADRSSPTDPIGPPCDKSYEMPRLTPLPDLP